MPPFIDPPQAGRQQFLLAEVLRQGDGAPGFFVRLGVCSRADSRFHTDSIALWTSLILP